MHAVRALEESTRPRDVGVDGRVWAAQSEKAASSLFDLVRPSDAQDEIPQDADLIRADFVDDAILTVSWYGNPEDTPEWYGKNLGFGVVIGDGRDGCNYGKRVANIINELSLRLTVEKSRVECADECSKNSADQARDLEIALRQLVLKAHGVRTLGEYLSDEDDDQRATHEFHVAVELAEELLSGEKKS